MLILTTIRECKVIHLADEYHKKSGYMILPVNSKVCLIDEFFIELFDMVVRKKQPGFPQSIYAHTWHAEREGMKKILIDIDCLMENSVGISQD